MSVELYGRGGAMFALGEATFDVYLNDRTFRWNVPAIIWIEELSEFEADPSG